MVHRKQCKKTLVLVLAEVILILRTYCAEPGSLRRVLTTWCSLFGCRAIKKSILQKQVNTLDVFKMSAAFLIMRNLHFFLSYRND